MIEECHNILECENKLSSVITTIDFLGEISISNDDINKLTELIKEQISENIQEGTKFLKFTTPSCLACFLVWKGIIGYQEGDYWPEIQKSIGLSDPYWQIKWGNIFLDFLKDNGLLVPEIRDARHYLTPILIHGIIPNSCLNEYFMKILKPMIEKELADPTDNNEINFLIINKRKNNEERTAIKEKIKKLVNKKEKVIRKIARNNSLISIWDDLEEIKKLIQTAGNINELESLPENLHDYLNQKNRAIQDIQKEIIELGKKKKLYEQQARNYAEKDKKILTSPEEIVQLSNLLTELKQKHTKKDELKIQENHLEEEIQKTSQSIFSERWNHRYAYYIRNLDFERLKSNIELLNSRKIAESKVIKRYPNNFLRTFKELFSYLFSCIIKKKKTYWEIRDEITEILKHLPIDKKLLEWPDIILYHTLRELFDKNESLFHLSEIRISLEKENKEQIEKISILAGNLGIDADKNNIGYLITTIQNKLSASESKMLSTNLAANEAQNIENKITELKKKIIVIKEEIQKIKTRLIELGNGNIETGIEQMEQRRDAKLKADSLRNILLNNYTDLNSLEEDKNEAQAEDKNNGSSGK